MKVHYLEIVSHDVNAVCKAYEKSYGVKFGDSEASLGGAKTCTLTDGSIVGVRSPLQDNEDAIVRPYWLVNDIELAIKTVEDQGAKIAMRSTEIPGRGKFAIYILGSNEHGFWEL